MLSEARCCCGLFHLKVVVDIPLREQQVTLDTVQTGGKAIGLALVAFAALAITIQLAFQGDISTPTRRLRLLSVLYAFVAGTCAICLWAASSKRLPSLYLPFLVANTLVICFLVGALCYSTYDTLNDLFVGDETAVSYARKAGYNFTTVKEARKYLLTSDVTFLITVTLLFIFHSWFQLVIVKIYRRERKEIEQNVEKSLAAGHYRGHV